MNICKFLGMKFDRVLVHWACAKVASNISDKEICNEILSKLEHIPGIRYAEIASAAYRYDKKELAQSLLEYEPRAADQIPLLISMGYDEAALTKAIESGDTDLVYFVILNILRNETEENFFRIMKNEPVALDLLISYCKERDIELLKKNI